MVLEVVPGPKYWLGYNSGNVDGPARETAVFVPFGTRQFTYVET